MGFEYHHLDDPGVREEIPRLWRQEDGALVVEGSRAECYGADLVEPREIRARAEALADERLGGFAAVGALEGDQHETASKGRRREHGYLTPCASGRFEEDRPSRHQARRGWVVGPHADNTPQSVGRHHLADRDHLGFTSLR